MREGPSVGLPLQTPVTTPSQRSKEGQRMTRSGSRTWPSQAFLSGGGGEKVAHMCSSRGGSTADFCCEEGGGSGGGRTTGVASVLCSRARVGRRQGGTSTAQGTGPRPSMRTLRRGGNRRSKCTTTRSSGRDPISYSVGMIHSEEARVTRSMTGKCGSKEDTCTSTQWSSSTGRGGSIVDAGKAPAAESKEALRASCTGASG